jgi:cell division protein FtsZ
MVMPGLINLDFADVRSVMGEMGKAMMGTGEGSGENRALQAAERAIANPLLDGVSMQGAKGVIISIIGGDDMRLLEVDEAANHIRELVDPNANIIWGSAFNPDLQGKIRVSVVATGIEQSAEQAQRADTLSSFSKPRGGLAVPTSEAPKAAEPLFTLDPPEPVAAPVAAEVFDLTEETAHPVDDADELDLGEFAEADDGEGDYAEHEGLQAPTFAAEPAADLLGSAFAPEPVVAPPPASPEPAAEDRAPRLSGGGSTLFERMANLSRGGNAGGNHDANHSDGDDDPDGGSAISIPRFLGRQNNQ